MEATRRNQLGIVEENKNAHLKRFAFERATHGPRIVSYVAEFSFSSERLLPSIRWSCLVLQL